MKYNNYLYYLVTKKGQIILRTSSIDEARAQQLTHWRDCDILKWQTFLKKWGVFHETN